MIAAETVLAKKLKIKFPSRRIEVVPAIKTCESVRCESGNCNHQTHKTQNVQQKSTVRGSNKRDPSGMLELQQKKKQKMDRGVSHQCYSLLKSLITHPSGWAFREPVDPVALNIPDYFSIISNPMDLGTIRSKLEKNLYFDTEEFTADVRLTFSNAMLYNPPANFVHKMAEKMNKLFEIRWKNLEGKWNLETSKSCGQKFSCVRPKEINDTSQNSPQTPPLKNTVLHKRSKPSKDEALRNSSNIRAAEVKTSTQAENCMNKASEHGSYKGTYSGSRHACGLVNVNTSLSPRAGKCDTCRRSDSRCGIHSDSAPGSSDLSSERSSGRDNHSYSTDTSKLDFQQKSISASQMSKSDPDSDGAVSAVDDENMCPSLQFTTPVTDATSREAWRPIFDLQLSPTKALRAAMLKHRFADTILKAQHKTLLDQGDKADPVKLQQEKERLEKRQRQEKAWIEAQIRAAEAASRQREEEELKRRREKEREAARLALQKMEKTAEIDVNLESMKELENLSGCSLSCSFGPGSPLEQFGLFIKDDFGDEGEMLNGDEEEGEIF